MRAEAQLGGDRFWGVWRWRGTRARRARGSPKWRYPRSGGPKRAVTVRTKANHGGGHRPGCWCRQRSSPSPRVDPVTKRLPTSLFDLGGETFTRNAEVWPLVGSFLLSPCQSGSQPFLDQSAHRGSLALGDFPGACEQILSDFYSRLHMGQPYHQYGFYGRVTAVFSPGAAPHTLTAPPAASPASRVPARRSPPAPAASEARRRLLSPVQAAAGRRGCRGWSSGSAGGAPGRR